MENLPTRVQNRRNQNRGSVEIYSLCTIAENFLHIFAFFKNYYEKITSGTLQDKLHVKLSRLFEAFRDKSKSIKRWETEFFDSEMRRVQRYAHVYIIECDGKFPLLKSANGSLYNKVLVEIEQHPYTIEVDRVVEEHLKEFSKMPGCSVEEKRSILEAMARELGGGIQQGHWYNCRCGYVYSVANCGMFNQSATCPSCKSGIGTGSTPIYIEQTFWSTPSNTRQ